MNEIKTSNVYQHRFDNLRAITERHGGRSAVAEKLGVSKQYITLILSPTKPRNIGHKTARHIESVFGLPVGSLDSAPGDLYAKVESDTVMVPMLNVAASMGHGYKMDVEEETIQEVRFSKRWIRQNTDASSFQTLAIVTGKGDSMEETFFDGSPLLVDTSVSRLKIDSVYVMRRDDELFIKRVQRNIDGSYEIISDNPKYKPQRIESPEKAGLVVLGKVLIALNAKRM
ncbi:MAG: helix-turn-helix transcriptional regulator [Burkholderiaceae bacterium]